MFFVDFLLFFCLFFVCLLLLGFVSEFLLLFLLFFVCLFVCLLLLFSLLFWVGIIRAACTNTLPPSPVTQGRPFRMPEVRNGGGVGGGE